MKRRYQTREEILKEIGTSQRRMQSLLKRSETMNLEAEAFFRTDNQDSKEVEHHKENRRKAEKMYKRAMGIENERLPRLKRTLQAMDTVPMPFIDGTITYQK